MLTWEYVEGNILRENIWLAEEKKNGEGKGGKYLEKENIFLFASHFDMFIFLTF